MRVQIMYIEEKPGLTGPARIGRVSFSKTGKTVYYQARQLQSLKGNGYKANYFDVNTGKGTGFRTAGRTDRTRFIRESWRSTKTSAKSTG